MNQDSTAANAARKHNIWARGLYMLLMGFILQFAGTLLFIVAVIQFVIVLVNDVPNARLASFGGSLATYLRQIAAFLSFTVDEVPFPFSDWPSRG